MSRLLKASARRNAWLEYALKQKESDMDAEDLKQAGKWTARACNEKLSGMVCRDGDKGMIG